MEWGARYLRQRTKISADCWREEEGLMACTEWKSWLKTHIRAL
jgi:hypothetical protein